MIQAGVLVITADIPLAAAVIAKGGCALDPRGEFYTGENIGEKLEVRKLMDELNWDKTSMPSQLQSDTSWRIFIGSHRRGATGA